MEDANKFVSTYTTKYNKLFALPINYNTSVFENVNTKLINTTLSVIAQRTFDKGCSIKYANKTHLAYKGAKQINFTRGTKCLVINTYDNKLLCNVDNELYQLVELQQNVEYSKNFDLAPQTKTKKYTGHIPPISHPWKQKIITAYLLKSKRTENYAYN